MPEQTVMVVLRWWYVPVVLAFVGAVLALGPWGWSHGGYVQAPTKAGCVGWLLVVLALGIALGGMLHA